ncbi:MAG TPA: AI-2E family transporter [Polyangiaceae bacterium]|jgi:predicted PurR-regulated permease PerM
MDRVGEFFRERTARRLLALALFITLLVLFREELVLLAFFVAISSAFGGATRLLVARTQWPRKRAFLVVLATFLVSFGVLAALVATRAIRLVKHAQKTFPHQIAELEKNPIIVYAREHLPDSAKLAERAREYSDRALHIAAMAGHVVTSVVIALILAVIYALEEDELHHVFSKIEPTSLMGTVIRWLGYVAEAIRITIQLQLVVAAVNTLLTLPVLLLLGIHHVPSLMILIFVSGLIPVVGNIVAGVVLCLLAYQVRGVPGVLVFVALTAVLHKIEAYYLNPRLTTKHVHLPGFLIVISLIAWEHLLGFAGLFVSFPFLFVASKIRGEMIRTEPPS